MRRRAGSSCCHKGGTAARQPPDDGELLRPSIVARTRDAACRRAIPVLVKLAIRSHVLMLRYIMNQAQPRTTRWKGHIRSRGIQCYHISHTQPKIRTPLSNMTDAEVMEQYMYSELCLSA